MEQWITILTFNYPHEAYVIRSKLESEGIVVFLKDENTVQAYNFLSNALGGVKLQVRERDVEEAKQIIGDHEDEEIELLPEEDIQLNNEHVVSADHIRCPNCNSENVSVTKRPNWVFAVSFLFLGFPLFFMKKRYHCFDCGNDFPR